MSRGCIEWLIVYTPTHENLPLQIKEKILCLEIMGVDSGKALSQSKGIRQKDLRHVPQSSHL
jgi:mTERF domain-containing protein